MMKIVTSLVGFVGFVAAAQSLAAPAVKCMDQESYENQVAWNEATSTLTLETLNIPDNQITLDGKGPYQATCEEQTMGGNGPVLSLDCSFKVGLFSSVFRLNTQAKRDPRTQKWVNYAQLCNNMLPGNICFKQVAMYCETAGAPQ